MQSAHLKLQFLEWLAFEVIVLTPYMAYNESTTLTAWEGQAKKSTPEMFHPPKIPQRQWNGNGTGFQRVPVANPLNVNVAPIVDHFF